MDAEGEGDAEWAVEVARLFGLAALDLDVMLRYPQTSLIVR